MPNWIRNIVEIHAPSDEKLLQVLSEIAATDDDGTINLGTIDFNKIIPTPDNIFQGNLGQEERKKYKKNNWYDWNCANWGTKWNANIDSAIIYEGDCFGNELLFETAWSHPTPVIRALAEKYPDCEFDVSFADEDISSGNCGQYSIDAENLGVDIYVTPYDLYPVELAIKIWDLENYYSITADNNCAVETDDEQFEAIEIKNETMFYSNNRFKESEYPKGLFKYELRRGEDENFCSLEKSVKVNFGGTVFSVNEIDLPNEGLLFESEDDYPNFLGHQVTFSEFRSFYDEIKSEK